MTSTRAYATRTCWCLAVLLVAATMASRANAAVWHDNDPHHAGLIQAADACRTYDVAALFHATGGQYVPAPSPEILARLQLDFPGWTFLAGEPMLGDFYSDGYDAIATPPLTSPFVLRYDSGWLPNPTPGTLYWRLSTHRSVLHWVQLVYTNDPIEAGLPTPYVDEPVSRGDDLPFYFTEDELYSRGQYETLSNAASEVRISISFDDLARRPLSHARPTEPVEWTAALFLAEWDLRSPGEVTLHDGARWGFTIDQRGVGSGSHFLGGVGADKYESDGILEDRPCTAGGVPAADPGSLIAVAVLLGMAGALVIRFRARRSQ